jgi:peptidoglycan hydrolase-like protein with peptidoglycan-binding domain
MAANPQSPNSVPNYRFTRNIQIGMTGNDVKELQIFLNSQGFTVAKNGAGSPGHETAYFGPATKTALMKFQLTYKKDILTPQGLTAPTGFFGAATMKAVNKLMK